jgi:hypothetical protein
MQSLKPGDRVLILPKFAHLFPANTAVVVSVNLNRSRPMLNEYTVEFPDGSSAKVFEFQIIEDLQSYTTAVARVIFDSRRQQADTQTRGAPGFQIILQTPQFDVDMTIRTTESRASIIGQILDRSTKALLNNVDVRLMRDGTHLSSTTSDAMGMFKFADVSRGTLNILAVIPPASTRILGAFSV